MRRLKDWFAPPKNDAALLRSIQEANSNLERTQREADAAKREHHAATQRLDRAMADSVKIAQDALREARHDG